MTHVHSKSGQKFEVGRLFDFDGRDYDLNVIIQFPDYANEEDTELEVKLIDFYFGDYDQETTDGYIDQYMMNNN